MSLIIFQTLSKLFVVQTPSSLQKRVLKSYLREPNLDLQVPSNHEVRYFIELFSDIFGIVIGYTGSGSGSGFFTVCYGLASC